MAVEVDIEKCTGCGACVDICPVEALTIKHGKAVIGEACVDCGACITECATEALGL